MELTNHHLYGDALAKPACATAAAVVHYLSTRPATTTMTMTMEMKQRTHRCSYETHTIVLWMTRRKAKVFAFNGHSYPCLLSRAVVVVVVTALTTWYGFNVVLACLLVQHDGALLLPLTTLSK